MVPLPRDGDARLRTRGGMGAPGLVLRCTRARRREHGAREETHRELHAAQAARERGDGHACGEYRFAHAALRRHRGDRGRAARWLLRPSRAGTTKAVKLKRGGKESITKSVFLIGSRSARIPPKSTRERLPSTPL